MAGNIDIVKLLHSMTMDEKIGQLIQLLPFFYDSNKDGRITGPLNALKMDEDVIWRSGAVIGVTNAKDMIDIQRKYLERSKHQIPLLFMLDINHGFRTIFPIPLGIACSWDTGCMEQAARITAVEAALSGIHVNFSPMADLVRDPRWGRVMESTGEDPYLNGLFAAAAVKGYQGNLDEPYHIIACLKHFAGYGAVEGGREYNTVDMSEHTLREYYLPSYKAAVEAGCEMVMASFNTVHGIPVSGNRHLLRDILRKEWGFDGVIISDWASIEELITHGVAADGYEAAKLAIEAGVDIEMMTSNYINHLKELIDAGEVSQTLLDEAVLRILRLKDKFGLFENPYKAADAEKAEKTYVCDEFRSKAREIASKSMVLLKNDGILPFHREQRIAVIGPHADNGRILGSWRAMGKEEETVTIYSGICKKIGTHNVITERGCNLDGDDESGFGKAIRAAKSADVILLVLGEEQDMSGEAASRAFINLPGVQERLLDEILKLNKPVAVVLFNGRPLEIRTLAEKAPALLEAWFPGTEGGNAIADIIYGDVNPSGRLTMSFPYTVGQIPVYYNSFNTGRPALDLCRKDVSKYIDIPNEPLYPFGYGLSYTRFEYRGLKLSKAVMQKDDTLTASILVRNMGEVSGIETVQLYIRDMVGSTVRPLRELKAFRQIELKKGEEKRVEFEITEKLLMFHDYKGDYKAEAGEFLVMIGGNSIQVDSISFRLI
jgi:beta-glucosidase